jgi:hypothetical protein
MSDTTKTLVQFIALSIAEGEFESALDKNGKSFARVRPGSLTEHAELKVKSASVYIRKNGCVQFLANIGGFNRKTQKQWARSANVTVKPIDEYASIVIENNKMQFLVSRNLLDNIIERLS